jgi:hypothetical protein
VDPLHEFAMEVVKVVERGRVKHPTDKHLCVHGLPLVVWGAPDCPGVHGKRHQARFRVHCSACVSLAVKRVLKGET